MYKILHIKASDYFASLYLFAQKKLGERFTVHFTPFSCLNEQKPKQVARDKGLLQNKGKSHQSPPINTNRILNEKLYHHHTTVCVPQVRN